MAVSKFRYAQEGKVVFQFRSISARDASRPVQPALATEDQTYTATLGSSPFVDRMTQLASGGTGDILKYAYTYNHSGNVATKKSANDSTSSPGLSYELDEGPGVSGSGASETVFRAIGVNGSFYNYYYDGHMHRRAKAYPAGDNDEYWYAGDQLIEDQGNLAQTYGGGETHYHPIDDYVWLGGRPVVIVHGSLDASDVRMADDGAHCSRERDGTTCGKYFPITDHIDKPVLMLDGNQKVAGVGEYDPFGQVNRVSLDAETDHDYTVSDATIADFTQPSVGGTTEDVRVKLQMVDLRSGNWSAHCGAATSYQDSAQLYDPIGTANLGTAITGAHTGGVWSDWVTPTADEVQVNLVTECAELQTGGTCSCSTSKTKTGLVMEGYEYRRYESAAAPFWTPFRFPGQYHDEESDLSQNWNRFYDGWSGAYGAPEPLSQSPTAAFAGATTGRLWPIFGYAGANPIGHLDPAGLDLHNSFENNIFSDSTFNTVQAAVDDLNDPIGACGCALTIGGGYDDTPWRDRYIEVIVTPFISGNEAFTDPVFGQIYVGTDIAKNKAALEGLLAHEGGHLRFPYLGHGDRKRRFDDPQQQCGGGGPAFRDEYEMVDPECICK